MNIAQPIGIFAALAVSATAALAQASSPTDPRITSWQLSRSGAYARAWESAADKSSDNAVSTWPRAGLTNRGGGQSTPTYSDVARVVYSTNYVYIYTTGLASYTMGPWLEANGNLFGMWPTNRAAIHQIPRNPTIPTTKTQTRGVGGVLVNGVYLWNNGDAQSYSTTTGTVSFNGQGVWNRLAGVAELATFDGGNAHQPNNGGQWVTHFSDPLIDVDSTGPNAAAAQAEMQEALAAVDQALAEVQDDAGVPESARIVTFLNPASPVYTVQSSSPIRSLGAVVLLGMLVWAWGLFTAERFRLRRLARPRRVAAAA